MSNLPQLRKQIDRIDDRIITLLNLRLKRVHRIGELKAQLGERIYNKTRERSLLDRLCNGPKRLLKPAELRAIYKRILMVSRKHQTEVFRMVARRGQF